MNARKKHHQGLIVWPDDLEVGQHYAVLGLKHQNNEGVQIAGMAFQLKALALPFVVGKLECDPTHGPVTFDSRVLTFMRVPAEYVQAQRPDSPETA